MFGYIIRIIASDDLNHLQFLVNFNEIVCESPLLTFGIVIFITCGISFWPHFGPWYCYFLALLLLPTPYDVVI